MIIDGKNHGVNSFLVQIRNDDLSITEGVHISDCGSKLGMNGMDNGILAFKSVLSLDPLIFLSF